MNDKGSMSRADS